ncbi:MAG: AmmeMemoRadiSam system protein B [Planctomycetota bacterium]|nr:AmmeMemoRadiSam system protein B [Planctomycetota bacterium]
MSESSGSTPSDQPQGQPQAQAQFQPEAAHHQRPKLRQVRGFPAQVGEHVMLGLADARQISDRVVFTVPAVQVVLPLMDGSRDVDAIIAEVGRGLTRPILEQIIAQLDEAGLLFGPTFDAMVAKMRKDFDTLDHLPPASTAAFADFAVVQSLGESATDEQKAEQGPQRMREMFDQWIAQALEKAAEPSFDELPAAVIAPHLDYPRGWMNYAAVWGRMRVVDRPERVVILGTNHFGEGTGVVGCDKGYQTPLGLCSVDAGLIAGLRRRLGDKLFQNRYDHEREHSIELQIPWIQHALGKNEQGEYCKVFGALVHDPAVNNGESYDGNGVGLSAFVDALRETIDELPGKTLVVSSADLSHVGPAFGDQEPLAGDDEESDQRRRAVFQHDQEMIELIRSNKPDELVAAMAWQQNPTRWCSTGNIIAAMMLVQPTEIELLNYAAAMDQQGSAMVSSMAAAMWGE